MYISFDILIRGYNAKLCVKSRAKHAFKGANLTCNRIDLEQKKIGTFYVNLRPYSLFCMVRESNRKSTRQKPHRIR